MQQENGSAAVSDSAFQNGSSEEIHGEESFIHQAMEIIIDEAVKKATNVNEKVRINSLSEPQIYFAII